MFNHGYNLDLYATSSNVDETIKETITQYISFYLVRL